MTKLLEHTFADRHDRMNLLRDHDIDRYFRGRLGANLQAGKGRWAGMDGRDFIG